MPAHTRRVQLTHPMAASPQQGGLLFGYDIGATSMALTSLVSSSASGTQWWAAMNDNTLLQGFVTAVTSLGAAIGSGICFKVERVLGRRRELLVAACLYAFGGTLEFISGGSGFAGDVGIPILVAGRVFYGVGVGFAMHGAPAYISEMAPPSYRGLLVSLKEAFIVRRHASCPFFLPAYSL